MSPQNGALRHLLLGVHTILCLGHRSFLFLEPRVAMGSVSSSPRGYGSVHLLTPRHPCGPVRIALPFVPWDDLPFRLCRQSAASSVPALAVRRTYPSCPATHTRPRSIICAQWPRSLYCDPGAVPVVPILPSSADDCSLLHSPLRSTPCADPAGPLS